MKKKILCAILSAMLIISSLPFAVSATTAPSNDAYTVELARTMFDLRAEGGPVLRDADYLRNTADGVKAFGSASGNYERTGIDASDIYTNQNVDTNVGMLTTMDDVKCIKISTKQARLGISASALQDDYFYSTYGEYPNYLKIESKVKTNYGAHYMYWGSKVLYAQLSSGSVRYYNNGKETSATASFDPTKWHTYTCYIDLATGSCQIYVDGTQMVNCTLDAARLAESMNFSVASSGSGDAYVNHITVSTIAPYGQEGISEYTNVNGDTKYGYVINNNTADTFTYGVYCAKFDANDELVDVVLGSDSVAANATELKNLTTEEAPAGGYCVYFVWEDLSTLKPLFEQKEVR